jgi:serine/threonine protein kinase
MTSARNIAPESPTSKAGSPLGSNKSSPSRPPIARKSYNTLEGVENLGTTHLEWGEYKLLRKIGVGAFGEVAAYRNVNSGRSLAVKMLNKAAAVDEKAIEDLESEVLLLSMLSHPHLVSLEGVGYLPVSGKLFVATEFLGGGNLQKLVQEASVTPGRFNDADITKWMMQSAEALAYLHSRDPPIVHRDLKLANIVLDGNYDAKIIDFGLARMMGVEKVTTTVRESFGPGYSNASSGAASRASSESPNGSRESSLRHGLALISEHKDGSGSNSGRDSPPILGGISKKKNYAKQKTDSGGKPLYLMTGGTGSFKYMAPEVYKGEPMNERLDVYSLAMIAYELLTRQIFLTGMYKNLHNGFTHEYDAEEWASEAAIDERRPPLEAVSDFEWKELLPSMWIGEVGKRMSASQAAEELRAMHERTKEKCTAPGAMQPQCGCVLM